MSRDGRIAMYVPSLHGAGAERVALNLARGMRLAGRDVDIVVVTRIGALLDQVPPAIRVVDLHAARAIGSLPAMVRYLRRERPRGVVAHMNHVNLVALAARRLSGVPCRIVATVHNTLSQEIRTRQNFGTRAMPPLLRTFYPYADGVVAVSRGVLDDLVAITGLPRDSARVIYNPVITPELLAAREAPPPHPWLVPGEPPVIVGAGRLTRQKNFASLLRAFATVRRRCPTRLMILGEGVDRPMLEALAQELGVADDVALPGFVPNGAAYMARAAVFALSSLWEGLPTVLIEALALGAPVVAADCPSGPREILRDGELGRLVPIDDPAALAGGIVDVLNGRGVRVTPAMLREYTLEAAAVAYLELIDGGVAA